MRTRVKDYGWTCLFAAAAVIGWYIVRPIMTRLERWLDT